MCWTFSLDVLLGKLRGSRFQSLKILLVPNFLVFLRERVGAESWFSVFPALGVLFTLRVSSVPLSDSGHKILCLPVSERLRLDKS